MAALASQQTIVPLAHAGHWILYLGPVLVVAVAVAIGAARERRRREEEEEEARSAAPADSVDDEHA